MGSDSPIEQPDKELEQAKEALESAHNIFEIDELKTAVNRAYYAVFHSARAVLWLREHNPKTHRGVHQQFHQVTVKEEGTIEPKIASIFDELEDYRIQADYGTTKSFGRNEVKGVLERAEIFHQKIIEEYENEIKE